MGATEQLFLQAKNASKIKKNNKRSPLDTAAVEKF